MNFNVPIKGDTVIEPEETFVLTLGKVGSVYDIGTQGTATVTVTDDDVAGVTFSTTPASPTVGVPFTVTATIDNMVQNANAPDADTAIEIGFYNNTSVGDTYIYFRDGDNDGLIGDPSSELSTVAESLDINGNSVTHSFTVSTAQTLNLVYESVGHTDSGFDDSRQFPDQTATIVVAAAAALPTLDFSAATYAHTETDSDTTLTVTINSSAAISAGGTVNITYGATSDASDHPATATDDYTQTASVTLQTSGTTHTFTIPVKGDEIVEPDGNLHHHALQAVGTDLLRHRRQPVVGDRHHHGRRHGESLHRVGSGESERRRHLQTRRHAVGGC